jgi:hypothetical protein
MRLTCEPWTRPVKYNGTNISQQTGPPPSSGCRCNMQDNTTSYSRRHHAPYSTEHLNSPFLHACIRSVLILSSRLPAGFFIHVSDQHPLHNSHNPTTCYILRPSRKQMSGVSGACFQILFDSQSIRNYTVHCKTAYIHTYIHIVTN